MEKLRQEFNAQSDHSAALHLVGCSRQIIYYISSYTPCLEAVSIIFANWRRATVGDTGAT